MTKQMQNVAFGASLGINPADAARIGVTAGEFLSVRNTHGELTLAARIDPQVQPGTVWIPESLPGAPVGSLLNGSPVEQVELSKAN